MKVEVIKPSDMYFEAGDTFDLADFVAWLYDGTVPEGMVVFAHDQYWAVSTGGCVRNLKECYTALQFATYRELLGPIELDETKTSVLLAVAEHPEMGQTDMSRCTGVARNLIAYHISDLRARGLIDPDLCMLTNIGEAIVENLD
jgi:hypothetical protein